MASTDGERLAPVTWLFGPPEPAVEDAPVPSSSSSATTHAERAAPEPEPAPRAPEPAQRMSRGELAAQIDKIMEENAPSAEHSSREGRFERISNVSMHALGRRGMSAAEMRDYLVKREFESDEVETEVERLLRVGLLDDVAFAETLVRTLRERKGLGRAALVAELRRRKLDSEAIDVALDGVGDDEYERALQLAEKRAGQLRSFDDETARRRLASFLMRKGYSGGIVQSVVDRALTRSTGGPVFR